MTHPNHPGGNDDDVKSWQAKVLYGLLCFGAAAFIYWHLTSFEEQGHGRMNWLLALAYYWTGKTGATLIFATPGAVYLILGLRQLVMQNRNAIRGGNPSIQR